MTYPNIDLNIFTGIQNLYIEKIKELSANIEHISDQLALEVAYMRLAELELAYRNNQIFIKNTGEIFIAGYKASESDKTHEFDDLAGYGYTIIQTQGSIQPSQAVAEHIDKLKKLQF